MVRGRSRVGMFEPGRETNKWTVICSVLIQLRMLSLLLTSFSLGGLLYCPACLPACLLTNQFHTLSLSSNSHCLNSVSHFLARKDKHAQKVLGNLCKVFYYTFLTSVFFTASSMRPSSVFVSNITLLLLHI